MTMMPPAVNKPPGLQSVTQGMMPQGPPPAAPPEAAPTGAPSPEAMIQQIGAALTQQGGPKTPIEAMVADLIGASGGAPPAGPPPGQ